MKSKNLADMLPNAIPLTTTGDPTSYTMPLPMSKQLLKTAIENHRKNTASKIVQSWLSKSENAGRFNVLGVYSIQNLKPKELLV